MTATAKKRPRRWIFRPMVWLWRGITRIANRVGILNTFGIAAAFLVVGLFLTSTLIGALLGIPLMFIGVLFVARGLY